MTEQVCHLIVTLAAFAGSYFLAEKNNTVAWILVAVGVLSALTIPIA